MLGEWSLKRGRGRKWGNILSGKTGAGGHPERKEETTDGRGEKYDSLGDQ